MFQTAIPARIGKYSIIRQIGAGATANVYLAQDEAFATVALKQLGRVAQTDLHKQMFLAEVELGQRLHHKNIVHVLGADLQEKTGPYLVMEYINGNSLDHFDNIDHLLPLKTVLSIIEQIASALRYAATLGVVHRDVKPANIILMPNGMAKLTDFGCAIPSREAGAIVAGSLAYMPPEQLEGAPLDQRADIYALGAVIYRLLTGKHTFEADNNFDARIAVLNFPAIPIQKFRKGLPPDLIRLIHRALEKNTADRHPDWDAFLQDLGNVSHAVRMWEADVDLYRGFSTSTQRILSDTMAHDRQFSRSSFSRSAMPEFPGG
jgi:serine/threonine protein kinase